MTTVLLYVTRNCPYCRLAEALLARKHARVEKIQVDEDSARHDEMVRRTGLRRVPQIFIGGLHVGGYRELAELDDNGELDALLVNSAR